MVRRATRLVALLAALGCNHSIGAKEHRMSSDSDEQAWHAAETTARTHYKNKGWEVTSIDRIATLPFLLRVGFSDGLLDTLVFDGKVVPEKTGTSGLTSYLRASDFVRRRTATADGVLRLLYYFGAFPTETAQRSLYDLKDKPELLPKLTFADGRAELVLSYVASPASPPGFGGSRADAGQLSVEQWVLTIPADYTLAWNKRLIHLPR